MGTALAYSLCCPVTDQSVPAVSVKCLLQVRMRVRIWPRCACCFGRLTSRPYKYLGPAIVEGEHGDDALGAMCRRPQLPN